MRPCFLANLTNRSRARCISLASVGKATALGCTVVSTMTFEKSAGFGRARARGDVQAFLDQRDELLLAHPLAPARQRRTVEHQRVPKELLAAEQLIIGVLDPALAQNLVGKVVHVLEDRKARHQTRRQRSEV